MSIKNIGLFLLIVLTAFLFWYSAALQKSFYGAVGSLEKFIGEYPLSGMAAFIALAALSAMLTPFSSVPLAPAAILIWGGALTMTLLLTGWLFGAVLAYFLGRYLGYPLVKRLVYFQKFEEWRRHLNQKTEFLMAFLLRSAVPSEVGYLFGVINYDFLRYFLITFLAELPVSFIAVSASGALLERKVLVFLGWVIFAFLAVSALLYLLKQKSRT